MTLLEVLGRMMAAELGLMAGLLVGMVLLAPSKLNFGWAWAVGLLCAGVAAWKV